jgi:hypothetical protein
MATSDPALSLRKRLTDLRVQIVWVSDPLSKASAVLEQAKAGGTIWAQLTRAVGISGDITGAVAKMALNYDRALAARNNWLRDCDTLLAVDESRWGESGTELVKRGDTILGLARNLKTATSAGNLDSMVEAVGLIALNFASAPIRVLPASAKYVLTQTGDVLKVAATEAAGASKIVGQGVADALSPVKRYLYIAAAVAALYFLAPLIKGFATAKARR